MHTTSFIPLLAALTSLVTAAKVGSSKSAAAATSIAPSVHDPQGHDNVTYRHFDCDTDASSASDHFLKTIDALHQEYQVLSGSSTGRAAAFLSRRAAAPIPVDTYFHIVTTAAHAGTVTASQVQAQISALNTAYKSSNVVFTLKNTSWTINDTWAVGASADDDNAMKTALRQGPYSALNLYFQSDLNGGLLGKCTLPTDVGTDPAPSVYTTDGCNIAAGTMPNGSIGGYNLGKTAVHETGHWLGLLHTFEGYSCSGSGDYVSDTPQESQSTNGCPTSPWKNSCASSRSGVDPIHNYMDYSTDACYTKFSAGQNQRIKSLWSLYRQGK